jgi:hypothetical protein
MRWSSCSTSASRATIATTSPRRKSELMFKERGRDAHDSTPGARAAWSRARSGVSATPSSCARAAGTRPSPQPASLAAAAANLMLRSAPQPARPPQR